MKILIALGGNAILKQNERGTFREQQANVIRTARQIARIIKQGHEAVITHGNGPQIGDILLRYEMAKKQLPVMPAHICGGESQGMMGYMIAQEITNELHRAGIKKEAVCLLTRTIVSSRDPNLRNPSKPIGPFYGKAQAEKLAREYGWKLISEGNEYRRALPSPLPLRIVELEAIRNLASSGYVVVCAGGGGIPVIGKGAMLKGLDAVIDKDLASSLLARDLDADLLMILTDVSHVFINFRKKSQKELHRIKVQELERYLANGEFEEGTMKPKVEAAISFVKQTGKSAVITSLENAETALSGKACTIITK